MNLHGLKKKRKNMIHIERHAQRELQKEQSKKNADEKKIMNLEKKLARLEKAKVRAQSQIRKLQNKRR
jgi:hypothetical protein